MGDNKEAGRKSFILHIDSLCVLNELTNEQKGILFDAIYRFQLGEIVELDFAMKMAFLPFRNQFKRDFENYVEKSSVNRMNGLKGGRPKNQTKANITQKTQPVLEKPKKADNDSDNDNGNDLIISFKKWNQKDFQNDIAKNKLSYTSEMLNNFYSYWSEKAASGKMKFQLEKTWETSKRLKTWFDRQKTFSKPETDNPRRGGSPFTKAL